MKRFLIICAAALCGLALACSESEMVGPEVDSDSASALGKGKPGAGGDAEPTPPGTIYVNTDGVTWAKDGDGKNLTELPAGITGEPSHLLHGPDSTVRWFLSSQVVETGCSRYEPSLHPYCYPDSTSMSKLELKASDGSSFTLLSDPLFDVRDVRWSPADNRISFYGRRFADAYSEASEGGIYTADIDQTRHTLSDISLVAPTSVWSPIDPRYPNSGCTANGICARYPRLGHGGHDWSRGGDRIAYSVCGNFSAADDSTYVLDVATGQSNPLFPWGIGPRWSSNELNDRLLLLDNDFYCWRVGTITLFAVNADGGNRARIDRMSYKPGTGSYINFIQDWTWSPTGSHVVYWIYERHGVSAGAPKRSEIIRRTADGGNPKVLDTIGWQILGWR